MLSLTGKLCEQHQMKTEYSEVHRTPLWRITLSTAHMHESTPAQEIPLPSRKLRLLLSPLCPSHIQPQSENTHIDKREMERDLLLCLCISPQWRILKCRAVSRVRFHGHTHIITETKYRQCMLTPLVTPWASKWGRTVSTQKGTISSKLSIWLMHYISCLLEL